MEKDTPGGGKQSDCTGQEHFHHCCCSHGEENFDYGPELDLSMRDFLVGLGAASVFSAWQDIAFQ